MRVSSSCFEKRMSEQNMSEGVQRKPIIKGQKTRPTTFEEYIRAYHTLVSKPLMRL